MVKQRVLFVDDDASVLAGLENLLYRERKQWDMEFIGSNVAALAAQHAHPFDVIVANNQSVLARVKDIHPATARIMLTGQTNREMIVRALPVVHQLLVKPCEADELRGAIQHALDLDRSHDERIKSVIGATDKLPSPPELFFELSRAMRSPTTTIDQVARIVLRDPGLAAKILQLVNSAYFGSGRRTSSIPHAVQLLGTERLRYISLTAAVFSTADVGALQQQSARAAGIASKLCPGRDDVFAAALLATVGIAVLVIGARADYERTHEHMRATGEPVIAAERATLGVDHAETGACLLGLWGLPQAIVEIVRHHHTPDRAPEALRSLVAAVHVADALASDGEHAIDVDAVMRAGAGDNLPQWRRIAEAA